MMLRPLPCLATSQFTYKDKTFSAESSDLGWRIGWPELGRVFDDACDEGFTLVSERTGKECVLAIHEVTNDPDYSGGWRVIELRPARLSERDLFRVVVFND